MNSLLAPIRPEACYPLPVFMDTVGLGRNALASARRDGLKVRKRGNRKYVLGADWIEFLKQHGTTEQN